MNLDENISKIIAKYVMGEITEEDSDILQEWLSDSYNRLLFKKIINPKHIAKELTQLEKIDSEKAYRKFKSKVSKRINIKEVLGYAAAILLPILGLLSLFLFIKDDYNPGIAENVDFDNQNISIVTGDGKLHKLSGNDTLVNTSNSNVVVENKNIRYKALTKKESLKPVYNTINIPAGGKYKLELSDKTIVHLNSATTFKYPVAFVGNNRNVQLISGEAFFEVTKSKKPFILNFGVNKIKVLGTKFNVKSYKTEDKEQITLEEGSISLNNSKNEIQLYPNQQAIISKNNLSIEIESVDAPIYSSWRTGFLNYKEEKLSTILNDFQRQYNVMVFYQNPEVKNKKLSISMDTNKSITQILKAIEATGDVKFKINNSNIIVLKK